MNRGLLPIVAFFTLVLVLLIGWLGFVSPQHTDLNNAKAQVSATRQQLGTLIEETAANDASQKNVGLARRYMGRVSKALPNSYDEPVLINVIQTQARRDHVDFESVSFTTPTSSAATSASGSSSTSSKSSASSGSSSTTATQTTVAGTEALGFSLTIAGNYFDLTRFAAQLQNMTGATAKRVWVTGRLLSFTGLTLTASKTAAGTVNATLTGSAYLMPSGTVAAAGTTGSGN